MVVLIMCTNYAANAQNNRMTVEAATAVVLVLGELVELDDV